jgi:hypothetical protein
MVTMGASAPAQYAQYTHAQAYGKGAASAPPSAITAQAWAAPVSAPVATVVTVDAYAVDM